MEWHYCANVHAFAPYLYTLSIHPATLKHNIYTSCHTQTQPLVHPHWDLYVTCEKSLLLFVLSVMASYSMETALQSTVSAVTWMPI